jgi:excinuclease ABC subunit A
MGMASFSFNKPDGACPQCTGLGTVYTADLPQILDDEKSVNDGAVLIWDPRIVNYYVASLKAAGKHYGFTFDPDAPVRTFGPAQRDLLLYGVDSPAFRSHHPTQEPPATVAKGRFEGAVTNLLRRHAEHTTNAGTDYVEKLARGPRGARRRAKYCGSLTDAIGQAGRVDRRAAGRPAGRGLVDRCADCG